MIKLGKVIGAVVLISFTTYSQVGINTIDPQEALHVNGKVSSFKHAKLSANNLEHALT